MYTLILNIRPNLCRLTEMHKINHEYNIENKPWYDAPCMRLYIKLKNDLIRLFDVREICMAIND
jgi:hypothetical protein